MQRFALKNLWGATLLLCALCVGVHTPASAQQRSPQQSSDPWTIARDAYRDQDWTTARAYTAAASQRDPKEPRYYLSLARIAFQQGAYEDAVWFYDVFIEYAKDQSANYSGTYAVDRAVAERKSANTRRDNPDEAPKEPDAQVRVRNALISRLKEGPVVRDSGGALATFDSMLRMGYANPDFAQLQSTLRDAAAEEADRLLKTGNGRFPKLSYQEWKQQAKRYQAADQLIPPAIPFDGANTTGDSEQPPSKAKAYQHLSEAQRQYLLQNWSVSARLFQEALEIDPGLHLAHQGRLNALLAADPADTGALKTAIDAFAEHHPEHEDLLIYQTLVQEALGDKDGASKALVDILTDNRASP